MKKNTWILLTTALVAVAPNAAAQQLDEIIVTATKRAENLQEVPLSVSVIGGDDLAEQSIASLEETTNFIPGVTVAKGNAADSIFIRGIGSGVNQGFEQSVGTFVDGVYYGRARSSRNPFFDLARVEVLKGPQATLFGKNTIGGAFNITSNRPTQEFEARVMGAYTPEFDKKEVEGIISGPLGDKVAVRLGIRYSDADGFMENTLTGNDEPATDELILRGQVLFQPSDDLEILLKAESNSYDRVGDNYQLTSASALLGALTAAIDPGTETNFDYVRSGPGTTSDFNFEGDETDASNFSATVNWDIGEHTLTSITSYNEYEALAGRDTDYSSLNFLAQRENQDYNAFGQEIRLASPTGGNFDYIVGGFYSSEELGNTKAVNADFTSVPPVAAFLTGVAGVPAAALTGRRNQAFTQDTTSWAIFGQGTYHISDTFRITGGLRYTKDEKDSTKELFYTPIGSDVVSPLLSAVYPNLGLGNVQALSNRSRSEDFVTGEAILEYDMSDDVMVFGRYARGFKAGGFDEDNVQGTAASAEFDREKVDAFEVGAKTSFGDGAGRFNVTGFYNDYQDLQVSTFDGVASFIVGNAATAETYGLEADLAYQVTDNWDIAAAASWLNATYGDYLPGPALTLPDGTNSTVQVPDPNNPGSFITVAGQDLSGRPLQFAPDFSLTARTGYEMDVSPNWTARFEAHAVYNSGYEIPGDLEPQLAQDDFIKVGGRISLVDEENGWSVAVIGKNLTNEKTSQWGNDLPLSNLLGTTGNNFFRYIDPPRSFTIQFSKNFN